MRDLHWVKHFLGLLLCIAAVDLHAQRSIGVIMGSVRDENGTPVAGAEVDADSIGSESRSKALRLALTDSAGAFRFDPVTFGTYKLYALKPDAGYPDTKFEFYSGQYHDVRATISGVTPQAEVRILVGPKCGVLKLVVLDSTTHRPISNPTVVLSRVDTGVWVSASYAGGSYVLVPPLIPIQVTVRASGYRDLSRGDPNRPDSGPPLRVVSGDTLEQNVMLEPLSSR